MIDGKQLPTLDAGRVRLRWLTVADVDAMLGLLSKEWQARATVPT